VPSKQIGLADLEHGDSTMSSSKHVRQQVASLASGECRWIGREDVHVYCRRPFVECLMPSGRMGWQPGPATYSVVCPSVGLKHRTWVPACQATDTVSRILQGFAVTVSAA
jgi:hypothetical protein